jgi:hypothetical protein
MAREIELKVYEAVGISAGGGAAVQPADSIAGGPPEVEPEVTATGASAEAAGAANGSEPEPAAA